MAPHDLASLLAPVDAQTFLRTCWGRTFQHVPGPPEKFSSLLPWTLLNNVLQQHRLDSPRLRLTREGKPIPASRYSSYQANRKRPNQQIPRLNATEFTSELREGATLVLDAVDEFSPELTDLSEALERLFRVRVQVNAYAGWRTSHGFDLHWDDHDVFILQVDGRKDWKIYGMTRKYPLAKDVVATDVPPDTPVWEGRLESGDLLYIPRGWWHVATPLDEPTLHLTVGVNNPTAADLLSWYVERLRADEHVRRDLPLFAPAGEQNDFIRDLQEVLVQGWSTNVLEQYLSHLDAKAQPRPRLNLPWAATADALPPEPMALSVKWNGTRRVDLCEHDGQLQLLARGRRWRFATAARPMLERLTDGTPVPLNELAALSDSATACAFVRELIAGGLIVVLHS
jgi:hypothetical protein